MAAIGFAVKQYGLFEKIKLRLPVGIWLLMALGLLCFVDFCTPRSRWTDMIAAPVFVFLLLELINGSKGVRWKRLLTNIGKASLNMWTISCIVTTPNASFQGIFIWPRHAFLIWLHAVFLCYMLSMPFSWLQNKAFLLCGKAAERAGRFFLKLKETGNG